MRTMTRGQTSEVRSQRIAPKALLVALAMFAFATPAFANITANYGFTTNQTLPDDGSAQYTTSHVIGGFDSYTNVTTTLTMSSPNGGNPMYLGDIYSSLTLGLPSETERVAVLLNRPGRTNTNAFGSSLSSLNVTLDDSATQPSGNIFDTTSSTGTYNSDGRLGVNPYKNGVAYNVNDRTNTLTTLNGSPVASNTFTLLMADTEPSAIARLDSWGMGITGAAATSGTMNASGGTFSITDDGGANDLGAALVTTQAGALNVTATGALTFSGVVSGTSAVTKLGSGSLTLSAANTYSGGTNLSAGTLNINNAGSGGTSSAIGTGLLTISGGTTIDNTTGGAITLSTNNHQNWNGDFTFTGTQDLNLGTGIVGLSGGTRQITVTNSNATLTVGGVIGDSAVSSLLPGPGRVPLPPAPAIGRHPLPSQAVPGITKAGAGTLTLTGSNTFTGTTTVSAGTLNAAGTGALGGTSDIVVNGGGTLLLSNTALTNRVSDSAPVVLSAGTGAPSSGGRINAGQTADTVSTSETLGALTLNNNSTIDFASTNGSHFALTMAGSGASTLSATSANFALVLNWDGVIGTLGTSSTDRLLFANGVTGFSNGQVTDQMVFDIGGTLYSTEFLTTGGSGLEAVAFAPVPEPSTWLAAALALGLLVFTQRRRFTNMFAGDTPAPTPGSTDNN